jgi:3-oxoadipate enol-lactonase
MPSIKVNDIDLYYETYGQGEPLVFIAGFTADHTIWEALVGAYTHKYQVIIFDNRGIGLSSDKPDYPYTAQVLADDTVGLLKALDFQHATLVGHSYGGCVAQTLAAKYPDYVKSVILVNTLMKAPARLQLFAQSRYEFLKANAPDSALIKYVSLMGFSNDYLSKANRIEQLLKIGLPTMSLAGYQHQVDGLLAFDSRQWVGNIKKPCLIICADEDLISDPQDSKKMEQAITDAEYFCFKNVGHIPMIEQPELFNKVVLQFLDKH